jgi:L-alanine-DL-glutamate epimerase-like enolase superfamily enzyme
MQMKTPDPPAYARWEPAYDDALATTVVRVQTDTKLVGWGEAKAPVAPEVCRDVVHSLLRPVLLGRDPHDVAPLWDAMYGRMALRNHRSGFMLEAISAVDIALWDVLGCATGLPICTLLGGAYRDRIPVYASGVVGLRDSDDDTARVAREAHDFATAGFRGVKVAIGHGVAVDVRSLEVARNAIGDLPLLADVAARYDLRQARQLAAAIDKLDLFLLEAPLPAELSRGYRTLARETRTAISSDLVGARWDWVDLLTSAAVSAVQPDVSRAGGLTESRRIAYLAEVFGACCIPHMSLSSLIHQAACAHFAATLPQLPMMEFWTGSSPLSDGTVGTHLEVDGGFLTVPAEGPGLGIDVDEDTLLSYAC